MTTLARIAIAMILSILFSSCGFDLNIGNGIKGNGTIQEDQRKVNGEFSEISVSEGLNVVVTQGSDFEILVEADENVIDLILTDLRNETLRVHTDDFIGKATKNVYVTLPKITALRTSSGSDLIAKGAISADQIKLDASSGSNLQVDQLNAGTTYADSSSGANIDVAGETNTFISSASSGSDISATNLTSAICKANASSGARISVNVTESLVAKASSGADIRYSGNAKIESEKSSAGSIKQL